MKLESQNPSPPEISNTTIQNPTDLKSWLRENEVLKKIHPDTLGKVNALSNDFLKWQRGLRFSVTTYYLTLVDWENPNCPILKQFLPSEEEFHYKEYENWDALAEEKYMPRRGLTHRYPDRVLWYLSHNCAVYCRFCMRKRKVSNVNSATSFSEWDDILSYISEHVEIKEVILSGGDPLSISNKKLDELLSNLHTIQHIFSIRIHSRMPVTFPARITEELGSILKKNFPLTLVTHFNHPKEITEASKKALKILRFNGVTVMNQSVLLNGINDSTEIQTELNLKLIASGVHPYYLHRCDEIPGTSHFRVPVQRGLEILKEMRGQNPGHALPRYMIDLPKGGGKIPLETNYVYEAGPNRIQIKNWKGEIYEIHEEIEK